MLSAAELPFNHNFKERSWILVCLQPTLKFLYTRKQHKTKALLLTHWMSLDILPNLFHCGFLDYKRSLNSAYFIGCDFENQVRQCMWDHCILFMFCIVFTEYFNSEIFMDNCKSRISGWKFHRVGLVGPSMRGWRFGGQWQKTSLPFKIYELFSYPFP